MTSAGDRLFGPFDAVGAWRRLADASVNYSLDEVRRPAWNFDAHRIALPAEPPGPPTPTGSWTHARRMVRDYEFSPPEIVRALYDPTAPLLGRDMLLEARFNAIHFYCGVRVTEVVDETRDGTDHVWGWAYETLDGHLERGKVTYEVVKHGRTGAVEFLATSYSQGAPALGPVTSLGWRLFGRRTQLRFYRRCGQRIRTSVEAALRGEPVPPRPARRVGDLVCAPSDAKAHRLDALAIQRISPAEGRHKRK
ncbi:DUF1990 family protein [Streptomyces sp. TR1341]|uniref:DUF1990 family protein n=1 Tax=Streptomyces TaxID=1883 RepID=UPI00138AC9C9|nr:DUF1990 family protein [Streptomyces murinus]NDK26616.1 DUF1990 family protein [Streptomyces sp. TR1341]WSI84164.1 DUF1990 domain-containing protein [Streptomyces murinus]